MEEWLKAHGSGNPEYTLDKHLAPGFVPYPTPWAPMGHKELEPFSEKELEEMVRRLETAISNIKVEARQKRQKRVFGPDYSIKTTNSSTTR